MQDGSLVLFLELSGTKSNVCWNSFFPELCSITIPGLQYFYKLYFLYHLQPSIRAYSCIFLTDSFYLFKFKLSNLLFLLGRKKKKIHAYQHNPPMNTLCFSFSLILCPYYRSSKFWFAISAAQGSDRYITVKSNGGLNQMRTGVSLRQLYVLNLCRILCFSYSFSLTKRKNCHQSQDCSI